LSQLNIVKIGGDIIDDQECLDQFLGSFARMIPAPKILVHGGGKKVSELAEKLGIPVQMIDGRRLTDKATLELTLMVYAGLINKTIIGKLQALHCRAVGLSGADGGAILAKKRPVSTHDYGFVGDIEAINNNIFNLLLDSNYVPVLCALTNDETGQMLNTNADTIAAHIAVALSRAFNCSLYYVMKLSGVLRRFDDPDSLIPILTYDEYLNLKENESISGGMIPKLDNAFYARKKGVQNIFITGYEHFQSGQKGTVLA
jgi:acetylglutamate kinase